MTYRPAVPASYDPSAQMRRAMIGKIKLAAKSLDLLDDDYRAILFRVTGKLSSTECTEEDLVRVIEEFKRMGFVPTIKGPRQRRVRPADFPAALKARALWISLHQLGAIADPSEAALEAFARRQLGCTKLQWADQALAYRLIEALKAMAERSGWSQDVAEVAKHNRVHVLRLRLCEAMLSKLKAAGTVPATWSLQMAAKRLAGIEPSTPHCWGQADYDLVAKAFAKCIQNGQNSVAMG